MTPPDPRGAALRRFGMSITALTVLGHTVLGFEQAYLTPVVAVLAAVVTEILLEFVDAAAGGRRPRYTGARGQVVNFLLPAYISGLACAMLLYANHRLWPVVLASVVAVSSKYFVRVPLSGRWRHVLNPSNTGIVVVLLLFPWVGIAPPYQFTEWFSGWLDALAPAVLLVAGTLLNAKLTRRVPLILGWLGGFVLQAVLRALITDISLTSALLPVTGVAFVLFTNYMITDPGTTPSRPRNQLVFGAATAAVYGVLVHLHIVFGLFFALVITCVVRAAVLVALDVYRRWAPDVPRQADAEPLLVASRVPNSVRETAR